MGARGFVLVVSCPSLGVRETARRDTLTLGSVEQFALTEASYVAVRLLQRFDKIENLDPETVVRNTLSLTSSTNGVKVRLHEASK
jgi:hypothetical protein